MNSRRASSAFVCLQRGTDNTYNSSCQLATTTHTLVLMATGVIMRVLVFGPTGGTGLELCAQAIGRGHDVTAFARSPSKLTESSLKVEGASCKVASLCPSFPC